MKHTLRSTHHAEVEMVACPECGLPAEVIDRITLPSTNGPMEHIKTRCVTGPWFLTPVEALEARAELKRAA